MPEEIMKIPCSIARDLMSVGENRRCCEAARPILQRHLAECPDCARISAAMAKPVAVETVSEAEAEDFRKKAEKMRRKNPLRTALKWAALSLAALILVLLGVNGFWQLTCPDFDVPMDQYDYELFQTEDGKVYGTLSFKAGVRPTLASGGLHYIDGILKIEHRKPVIDTAKRPEDELESRTDWLYLQFIDGKLYYYTDEYLTKTAEVKDIRLVYRNGDFRPLWREGDDIPVKRENG